MFNKPENQSPPISPSQVFLLNISHVRPRSHLYHHLSVGQLVIDSIPCPLHSILQDGGRRIFSNAYLIMSHSLITHPWFPASR